MHLLVNLQDLLREAVPFSPKAARNGWIFVSCCSTELFCKFGGQGFNRTFLLHKQLQRSGLNTVRGKGLKSEKLMDERAKVLPMLSRNGC